MASDADRFAAQDTAHDHCVEDCGRMILGVECPVRDHATIEDIEYQEDVTYMYSVDMEGNAIAESDHTDGDLRCYLCLICEREFSNFKDVQKHIGMELA